MSEYNEDIIVEGTHNYSSEKYYVHPSEEIKKKLEEFKDMKLGFMIHWGLYAQLGLIASWGLVDAEAEWSRKDEEYDYRPNWHTDGNKIREEYFDLIRSFNPVRFNPDEWAELAEECGFKYLIFTTKHHDGFCMWDTKQTDFKITAKSCPFSKHEKADVTKHIFDAFRKRGMTIGAYFSKPDWHSEDYWESDVCKKTGTTRMPTYDVKKKPEKWKAFTEYTHKQFEELVKEYGKIDILWLDGGCVCKKEGLDITCETAPHYLILNDMMLRDEGRFKMNPPIRGEEDRLALIEGIKDGTIDMIATDHAPHSAEEKAKGLKDSLMGIVGIETAFPLLYTHLVKKGIITLEKLIELMSTNPRKRFNLPLNNDYCVWDLDEKYIINPEKFFSKGRSTPFENCEVYAKHILTIINGQVLELEE